jgi:AraC-like DNA-binding protein
MRDQILPVIRDHFKQENVPSTGQPRFYVDNVTVFKSCLQYHNHVEISFFLGGEGYERINSVRHCLKPGTMSLVLPHQIHYVEFNREKPVQKYRCFFDLDLLFRRGDDDDLSQLLFGIGIRNPSFIDFSDNYASDLAAIFRQLQEESRNHGSAGRQHMIRAKLTEALLLFIRTGFRGEAAALNGALSSSENKGYFWAILHYIHTRYGENLTLEQLSKAFGLSVPYISQLLKKQTGTGFIEYLHRLRIEAAAGLLQNTSLSVTEIAYEVGFDSFATFARVFKNIKGHSARSYRNTHNYLTLG